MTLISVIPAWSYNRECSYGSLGIAMIGINSFAECCSY